MGDFWDVPYDCPPRWRSASDLLDCLVEQADRRGRYYANPRLVRRLQWDHDDITAEQVETWIKELIEAHKIVIRHDGTSSYSEDPVPIIHLVRRQQYRRFKPRIPIPEALRAAVLERDGYRCLWCAATEPLHIDHIHPWSKGGENEYDNLQTLCGPCNIRKGANVE